MHVLVGEDVFVVVDIAQKALALFEEDALFLFDELAEAVARFVVPHTFFDFARAVAVLIERSAAPGELCPVGDILRAGKCRGAPRVVFGRYFAVFGRLGAFRRRICCRSFVGVLRRRIFCGRIFRCGVLCRRVFRRSFCRRVFAGLGVVRPALFGQFVILHIVPLSAPSRGYGQRECL